MIHYENLGVLVPRLVPTDVRRRDLALTKVAQQSVARMTVSDLDVEMLEKAESLAGSTRRLLIYVAGWQRLRPLLTAERGRRGGYLPIESASRFCG